MDPDEYLPHKRYMDDLPRSHPVNQRDVQAWGEAAAVEDAMGARRRVQRRTETCPRTPFEATELSRAVGNRWHVTTMPTLREAEALMSRARDGDFEAAKKVLETVRFNRGARTGEDGQVLRLLARTVKEIM